MPCRVISNLYAPQNQPSLEFALTLRHFLHKTVPSSPPQQGVGIKSRLYHIFVMNIMEIASFGGNLSKTRKKEFGYLAKNMKTMTDLSFSSLLFVHGRQERWVNGNKWIVWLESVGKCTGICWKVHKDLLETAREFVGNCTGICWKLHGDLLETARECKFAGNWCQCQRSSAKRCCLQMN